MPLYMDVHHLDGPVSADDVAKAHMADLQVQDKYDVNYQRYWVDEASSTIFCLVEAPSPDAANFAADLNPQSLEILTDARIEPAVAQANSPDVMQFERQGYFVRDQDSTPDRLVFNRTIGLRDTFAKEVGGKG